MKALKNISIYIVVIVVIILLAVFLSSLASVNKMTYSEFLTQLENQNVVSAKLENNTVVIKLKEDQGEWKKDKEYQVTIHSQQVFEEHIIAVKAEGNPIEYTASVKNVPFWVTVIPYILMIVLFVILLFVLMNQSQAGASKVMNFGKSRARLYTTSKITFADVAGAKEEKEEMMELVSFLKDPKRYSSLGARIPKGVLMVGPPGTGKTYLAKAVAGEAGVPFFSISGSDFVEMYVGVGASRVRDLFEQAKKNSPCIIFIDEIDAVGRHRGAGLGGGHDEREQTLNQLLVEMDGFGVNEGVIIIAATNRPDILDPALTRPGRFDRKIVVGYPDIKAREEILRVHVRNKPLSPDVDLAEVAKETSGFTAADLENLLNEAALLAARERKDAIGLQEIKEGIFRVVIGPEKRSHVMTEKEKRLTALHETGHAMAVKLFSTTDKVDRISIIPAGSAGGYTSHRPDEDVYYQTKAQLFENIIISLGGRAAEELVLNEISTGASSDLQHANSVALKMVTKYGMSDSLNNLVFDSGNNEVFIGKDYGHTVSYSQETAALIDKEVKKLIEDAYQTIKETLTENLDKLNEIANVLLERERIEGDEFNALMEAA